MFLNRGKILEVMETAGFWDLHTYSQVLRTTYRQSLAERPWSLLFMVRIDHSVGPLAHKPYT